MAIGLAIGGSLTPFVPVPFVDDWIYERLLRRAASKVMERSRDPEVAEADEKSIVRAYLKAGGPSFGTKTASVLVRFAIRKVGLVLDVKRSHDAFGEAIAFALALDTAVAAGKVTRSNGDAVGMAIYNALQTVGSGFVDAIARAARETYRVPPSADRRQGWTRGLLAGGKPHERVMEAIGKHVDEAYGHLERAMAYELRER